jgi:hypothetical protein
MTLPHLPNRLRVTIVLLGVVALSVAAGCVSNSDRRYAETRQVSAPDVYVYYPAYEVYYNRTRGEYVYYEGNAWVARREPPRRFSRELRRAPSVRVEFNDAPEHHHSDVVRRYPRTWNGQLDERSRDGDRRDGRRRHDSSRDSSTQPARTITA